VRGDYRPGDRLPTERELALEFGVARSTVREALGRLIELGMLRQRQGSGTYVGELNFEAMFAVRLQLEPFAARGAAQHRTDAQLAELRRLLDELRRSTSRPARFAQIDHAIHRAIAVAAHNPVLLDMIDRLAELTLLSRAITSPDPELRAQTAEQLGALVDAIAAHQPAAAARTMATHLRTVQRSVPMSQAGDGLADQGPLDPPE
jgi:GntR family transcriptional regulator, transcriptional repressor for pyruvate dehydrogenase complex